MYDIENHSYCPVVVAWLGKLELSNNSVVGDASEALEKYFASLFG